MLPSSHGCLRDDEVFLVKRPEVAPCGAGDDSAAADDVLDVYSSKPKCFLRSGKIIFLARPLVRTLLELYGGC